MKSQPIAKMTSSVRSLFFLNRWAFGIVLFSSLVTLIATLIPFDFTIEGVTLKSALKSFFSHGSDSKDIISNVFLFMPFGFGIAWELHQRRVEKILILAMALVLSVLFSLGVETLQVFLPSRSPSWIDLCTNGSGGAVGALSYFFWDAIPPVQRSQFLTELIERRLSAKTLVISLIAWVIFSSVVCLGLQQAAHLTNWDSGFPFLVGNEQTGDRPWKGKVSQLQISDRAIASSKVDAILKTQGRLPNANLVADYSLAGQGSYRDRSGNLPDLVWQGQTPSTVEFSDDHWLTTKEPAIALSDRLKKTSEFTIYATIAASESEQEGPARILSLSNDPGQRNFTLGQEGSDLVFRLRTPITGENGVFTALFVPGVFSDTKPHQVIVSYQNSFLRAYIDRVENTHLLELVPKITLFRYLLPLESQVVDLDRQAVIAYTILFYSLFFIPLGVILALIHTRIKGGLRFHFILFISGIVIPSLLLEFLMYRNYVEVEDLVISISIGAAAMLFTRKQLKALLY